MEEAVTPRCRLVGFQGCGRHIEHDVVLNDIVEELGTRLRQCSGLAGERGHVMTVIECPLADAGDVGLQGDGHGIHSVEGKGADVRHARGDQDVRDLRAVVIPGCPVVARAAVVGHRTCAGDGQCAVDAQRIGDVVAAAATRHIGAIQGLDLAKGLPLVCSAVGILRRCRHEECVISRPAR